MALPERTILACGLKFNTPLPVYFQQKWGTEEEIVQNIRADLENTRKAGFVIVSYQLHADRLEEGLRGLEEQLKQRRWDGVIIGAAVRLVPEFSAVFEAMINVCRKHVSADVPFMFNDGPMGHYDAVQRAFRDIELKA